MKLGDFLIESRCSHGHTSAIAFRGYARAFVELVLGQADDACPWAFLDGSPCDAKRGHALEELGPSDTVDEARRAFWRASTAPAMPAADVGYPGPRDSSPPAPPATPTKPFPPPPPSGGFVAGEE